MRPSDIRDQVGAINKIQAAWRGYRGRTIRARNTAAALVIQHYMHTRFQKTWNERRALNAAATAIQRVWRGGETRQSTLPLLRAKVACAEIIQATFRAHSQQRRYLRDRASVRSVQSLVRMKQAQSKHAVLAKAAAAAVAAAAAAAAAAEEAAAAAAAAVAETAETERRLCATVTLQAGFRSAAQRQQFAQTRRNVITLQAAVRCRQAQSNHAAQRGAALAIQSAVRGRAAAQSYKAVCCRLVGLQARVRMRAARALLGTQHGAATAIGKHARGVITRLQWAQLLQVRHGLAAAIPMEKLYRSCKLTDGVPVGRGDPEIVPGARGAAVRVRGDGTAGLRDRCCR